jgi:Demerecviridae HNH endonuclease
MKSVLTAERLRQLLEYFPETGAFRWRVKRGPAIPGKEAGSMQAGGYVTIRVERSTYKAHRLAWLHVYGRHPAGTINHRNGDPADNRIENLEEIPFAKNMWYRTTRNQHAYKGVYKYSSKFCALIKVNGKRIFLGSFPTAKEAGAAYMGGARVAFGRFARANPPRRKRRPSRATTSRRNRPTVPTAACSEGVAPCTVRPLPPVAAEPNSPEPIPLPRLR